MLMFISGFWLEEFSESNTRDWYFKVTLNQTTKIKLMNKTAQFMYGKYENIW